MSIIFVALVLPFIQIGGGWGANISHRILSYDHGEKIVVAHGPTVANPYTAEITDIPKSISLRFWEITAKTKDSVPVMLSVNDSFGDGRLEFHGGWEESLDLYHKYGGSEGIKAKLTSSFQKCLNRAVEEVSFSEMVSKERVFDCQLPISYVIPNGVKLWIEVVRDYNPQIRLVSQNKP